MGAVYGCFALTHFRALNRKIKYSQRNDMELSAAHAERIMQSRKPPHREGARERGKQLIERGTRNVIHHKRRSQPA